ncbi:MAG TPA: LysR family transcriptional regulator [Bradyrhizobium sp.]|nr:LysR family transcriptional regulator [Bradyrhizobium sp.]
MRVFAKVVEQGGFARAGSAMNMSNAVVTRHVADLEEHLGTRLLNRTTRKLSLTETGLAYLERVRQILQDIEEADAIASYQSQTPGGALRIYSQVGFGQTQLAKLLPDYAGSYPDVVLDVMLSDRAVDLVEEGFDVGIFLGGVQKFDASMIARQLGVSEVYLCASPGYVERCGAPLVPEDLAHHACLNFSFEQLRHSWLVSGAHGSVNIPVTSRMFSNNGDLLRQCAAAGMGLVFRPSFALCDDLANKRLVRVLPAYRLPAVTVVMVYPSRRLLSAKVRSFVDFISAKFPRPEEDPWGKANNSWADGELGK